MTLLVTGFGPFPGVETNPSGLIVQQLAEAGVEDLVAVALPTEFHGSFDALERAVRRHGPSTILMLGVSQGLSALSLERFALNWIEDGSPDACGVALGAPVVADAPLAYPSTLPLDGIAAALRESRIPFEYSAHAGTYVCNCLFYRSLHHQSRAAEPVATGFVHIPMPRDVGPGLREAPLLAELTDWIRVIVSQLVPVP